MNSKDHQSAAEHHVRMGSIHKNAFTKAAAMEDEDGESFHKAMAAEHATMASYHLSCCKTVQAEELSKAAGMHDDAIRPDGISSVIGNAPNIHAVFRNGQRQFGLDKTDVDPGLEKVIGIEE
jgi:hypothetical protein